MNDLTHLFPNEGAWKQLPDELNVELHNILDYWKQFTPDHREGGFLGKIDSENKAHPKAPKGSVLNARILWAFSAAYRYTRDPAHLELATRAYHYIREHLTDPEYGGLVWLVDYKGTLLDGHKQVYAQAFGIYAMTEYFKVSCDPNALEQALEWYRLIEKYSRDPDQGGYIEAFSRDWSFLEDKRLSSKDENASKTMNTHLHVVEAYANLYDVWPDDGLKNNILDLLKIFDTKIIDQTSYYLGLFFTNDWQIDSTIQSYGHDIEAAWLLQSCAESIGDEAAISTAKRNAIRIAGAAMDGLDEDGGLWYEYDIQTKELIYEKHWWPQAEALIGFCNAWQLTRNPVYKTALLKNWNFIREHILDKVNGEWFWGIDRDKRKMAGGDKVGIWKCPYHNTRACLELLRRIKKERIKDASADTFES